MVGKGSVNHNSRKFLAENVDRERTHLNIDYCNEPIKEVYHKLFDEALERYNAKQARADRIIENYYEKIRTGRQEKLFHDPADREPGGYRLRDRVRGTRKGSSGRILSGISRTQSEPVCFLCPSAYG